MADFRREKNVLQQLVRAREAIKRKYNLLKFGKDNFERQIGETFKPIVDPLQELVAVTKERNQAPINDKPKKLDFESDVMSDKNFEDDSLNDTLLDNTLRGLDNTAFETAGSEDEASSKADLSSNKYIQMLKRSKDVDKIYGIRSEGDHYMLADKFIQFDNKFVILEHMKFPMTNGLMELLIAKHPDKSVISSNDMQNYRVILEQTNVHRKNYKENGDLRTHNSKKYSEIIAPLFSEKKKTGGSLPRYKIARKNMRMDYVYWDDPNELVDRLRLLMAERSAGNPSHINEIHSIIAELREADYIY